MKILILGLNYYPEVTGIGKYTGEACEWLANKGHEVRVITTPPYYPDWSIGKGYKSYIYKKEKVQGVEVVRCPLYVPKLPSTVKRIFHLLSFAMSNLPILAYNLILWRPCVLIYVVPTFFCAPLTILLCKLLRVKCWIHFQDFEICAMFGAGMGKNLRWISKYAHILQSFITRRFDIVSTISRAMCRSAKNKEVSKDEVFLFPNWVDVNFLNTSSDRYYFRRKWGISEKHKVVLYSGNLGLKQGLELLIDVARKLENKKDILFVVVGEGAFKTELLKLSKDLSNIQFYPLQPYSLLPKLLRMADIHLILQKKGTADALLPSKLTGILSIGGRSIVTAEETTELGQLILENEGLATLIPPEDVIALQVTIEKMCADKEYSGVNDVARAYAVENMSKDAVLNMFEEKLLQLTS